MSDEGFNGGDLFRIPAGGGEARNMTPRMKGSASGLKWQENQKIVFTETVDGGGAIAELDVNSGQQEVLWKGGQDLHEDGNFPNFGLAKDGRTSAAIRNSWEPAPEVSAGPIGDWRQITHANTNNNHTGARPRASCGTATAFSVQGWLLYPENYDPSRRYPMVV